ncbi:MAG: SUMF1/EgtB/PvdO family nonheme iron enzyme, partial [Candidatus Aminicenantes bacterium]|nr:SUMF1/EgtB/PvdO family nonheme iron enzyme [Candidatus Aminicenantes bacterium]
EFLMGDNHGLGSADELPVHKVYLDSYKISKYEITYAQFDKFFRANSEMRTYYEGHGQDHPVTMVRRYEVDFFCEWVTEYSGKYINLPTEAQWEKAARGIDQRLYPWGDESPDCGKVNYNNCIGKTSPVGSYPGDISYYGVMDMGGNVSELTYDAYQEDFYSVSPYSNPLRHESDHNDYRVLRGGNWGSSDLRASRRESLHPMRFRDYIGFRVIWID